MGRFSCLNNFLLVTCFLQLILTGVPCQAAKTDDLRVLLRYDDYSRFSNSKFEQRLFDTVGRLGGTLVVGVIPFPGKSYPDGKNPFSDLKAELGEEKVALLKKYVGERVVDIALHGYSHRNNFQNGHGSSEFAGLPATQQRQLLKIGKAALEASLGMPIHIFVPPFNAYDLNTISALETVGFKLMSAGGGGPSPHEVKMKFLPGTTYPDKLRRAVITAHINGITDGLIVVTMHSYDFVESGQMLPNFRQNSNQVDLRALHRDIEWIQKRQGVSIVSFKELLYSSEDLSGDRLAANNRIKNSFITRHVLVPNLPWLYAAYQVYYTQEMADRIYYRQLQVAAGMYGVLFVASLVVPCYLLRAYPQKFIPLVRPVRVALLTLLGLIIYYTYVNGFYMKAAMAVTFCAGWLLGTFDALRKSQSQMRLN